MGGENSGVDETTTTVVVECAIFRAGSVRWTSRSLGLSSDSSYRYERGVDPHSAMEAAWRAIDLIVETAGGEVVGPVCVVGGDVPWKREIALSSGFVRERLGFDVPVPEMRAALESLELSVVRETPLEGGAEWTVSIPSWRDDIDRPIDLVEEILRIHGTERMPTAAVETVGPRGGGRPGRRLQPQGHLLPGGPRLPRVREHDAAAGRGADDLGIADGRGGAGAIQSPCRGPVPPAPDARHGALGLPSPQPVARGLRAPAVRGRAHLRRGQRAELRGRCGGLRRRGGHDPPLEAKGARRFLHREAPRRRTGRRRGNRPRGRADRACLRARVRLAGGPLGFRRLRWRADGSPASGS